MLEVTRSLNNQIMEYKKNLWRIPLSAFILGSLLGMAAVLNSWNYTGLLCGLAVLALCGVISTIFLLIENLYQVPRLKNRLAF